MLTYLNVVFTRIPSHGSSPALLFFFLPPPPILVCSSPHSPLSRLSPAILFQFSISSVSSTSPLIAFGFNTPSFLPTSEIPASLPSSHSSTFLTPVLQHRPPCFPIHRIHPGFLELTPRNPS